MAYGSGKHTCKTFFLDVQETIYCVVPLLYSAAYSHTCKLTSYRIYSNKCPPRISIHPKGRTELISAQPRISTHPHPHPTPSHTNSNNFNIIRDPPEDGVFFRLLYRNLALLHHCFLLLPFIVLLQNEHTSLAENSENLTKAPSLE